MTLGSLHFTSLDLSFHIFKVGIKIVLSSQSCLNELMQQKLSNQQDSCNEHKRSATIMVFINMLHVDVLGRAQVYEMTVFTPLLF